LPAEVVATVNDPSAPFFETGSPGTSIYPIDEDFQDRRCVFTRVTRRRPSAGRTVPLANICNVPSMVITGPGDESLWYWGGHSTIDTAADPSSGPAGGDRNPGRSYMRGKESVRISALLKNSVTLLSAVLVTIFQSA